MTTSEQRKQVRTKIEAGSSPQQVYDELHGPGNAANEELADLVRYVPTMERRTQFRTGHLVLMGLLCLAIAWKFGVGVPAESHKGWAIAAFHVAYGIGYAVALFAVAKYWRKAYSFAGLLAFIDVAQIHNQHSGTEGMGLVVMFLFVVLAVLAFYLQRELTPAYIKLKEKYRNSDGQERLRELVRFGD